MTPLVAVVVLFAAVVALALARAGSVAVDAARARTAADAAALAGAADGLDAARDVAADGGGELVRFESGPGWVEVLVRVGSAEVSARAEQVDAGPGVMHSGDLPSPAPESSPVGGRPVCAPMCAATQG